MNPKFAHQTFPFLQKQIEEEEKNYQESLKKDVPFFMLKEIRIRIRKLKAILDTDTGYNDLSIS